MKQFGHYKKEYNFPCSFDGNVQHWYVFIFQYVMFIVVFAAFVITWTSRFIKLCRKNFVKSMLQEQLARFVINDDYFLYVPILKNQLKWTTT